MLTAESIIEEKSSVRGVLRRVLLVDASRLQRRILSASLMREGFEVLEAESAEEALNTCRLNMPDLVLSEWVLPDMVGLEFCKQVRALPSDHYCYFVVLTAKSEKDAVVKSLRHGADDFLLKPVDAHELNARLTAAERILSMQREISENYRELQRVQDLVDKDLQAARNFQESLVRDRVVTFPGGQLSMMLEPSGHVGGDLVGHYKIDRSRFGLFAIDVSGHGISSALMTARLAGYLSSTSQDQNIALIPGKHGHCDAVPPHQVVEQLNSLFLDEIETEHYFTMVLAEVDLSTGKARLCQGGHPHPLVQRADGRIEQHGAGGLPVGLIQNARYSEFELTLSPGDRLIILSDGCVECPDAMGRQLDDAGLEGLIKDLAGIKGVEFLENLFWRLQEHAGSKAIPDDVSGILFEFDPPKDALDQ